MGDLLIDASIFGCWLYLALGKDHEYREERLDEVRVTRRLYQVHAQRHEQRCLYELNQTVKLDEEADRIFWRK